MAELPWARALVTGASSGIGRELARLLARGGVEVVLAARRAGEIERLAGEIALEGGRARVLPLDVRDTSATVTALRALDDEAPLDLVIACAAAGSPPSPLRGEGRGGGAPWAWEAIAEACHTNFCGAAATLTAVLPAMVARGRGHLVGLSSIASFGALPGAAAYCAPKAGLSMLLDCLRLDLAAHGVAVTAVHAGFVRTPMVAQRHGSMPLLLEAADAAERIVRALPAAPARIDFPAPLALAARAFAALPAALRDPLARRMT